MYNRFAVLCLLLFSLGFVSAFPSPDIVVRQVASATIPAVLASPTSVTTTNIIQTPNGNVTQTCVTTFTPVGQQIQEVQNCTTSMGTVSSPILPSGTAVAASTPSASPMVAAPAPFSMPGTTIQVLPIGLGIFGGITSIAVAFVAFVTLERVQYRKAFRQQKVAETTMRYGAIGNFDSFVVTFLVDNCIEWMTKLPPGFSHEMRQHLFDQKPEKDPRTGVPILDFENFCCGAHGFSALIETQVNGQPKHLILFDTGPDSKSIVRNVTAMQTPVNDIETVILSHWHNDHSGGMLSFLRMRSPDARECIVDLHPDRPEARGIAVPPTFETVIGRLPDDPTFEQIEAAGGRVRTSEEAHTIADGTVYVSGEIPRVTDYETGLLGGMRFTGEEGGSGSGRWKSEPHIMDERYAAVDVAGKGLIIFSACSHAGIVNVVMDAVQKLARPVYMVIGGLHLAGPELVPRIPPTVNFLANQLRPAPTYILPMHCSGFQSKVALERAFGEGCVPAGVGMKVEVRGDREGDARLLPAVFS